jgi:hypothetical protein
MQVIFSLIIAHRTSCGDVTSEWSSFYTVGLFQTRIYSRPVIPPSPLWTNSPAGTTIALLASMLERRQAQALQPSILIIPNILLLDPIHMEPLFPNPIRSNRALYLSCGMVNVRPRVNGFNDPPYALLPGNGLFPPLTPAADPGPIYNNNNNGQTIAL